VLPARSSAAARRGARRRGPGPGPAAGLPRQERGRRRGSDGGGQAGAAGATAGHGRGFWNSRRTLAGPGGLARAPDGCDGRVTWPSARCCAGIANQHAAGLLAARNVRQRLDGSSGEDNARPFGLARQMSPFLYHQCSVRAGGPRALSKQTRTQPSPPS
jgi:hypothetical protein